MILEYNEYIYIYIIFIYLVILVSKAFGLPMITLRKLLVQNFQIETTQRISSRWTGRVAKALGGGEALKRHSFKWHQKYHGTMAFFSMPPIKCELKNDKFVIQKLQ